MRGIPHVSSPNWEKSRSFTLPAIPDMSEGVYGEERQQKSDANKLVPKHHGAGQNEGDHHDRRQAEQNRPCWKHRLSAQCVLARAPALQGRRRFSPVAVAGLVVIPAVGAEVVSQDETRHCEGKQKIRDMEDRAAHVPDGAIPKAPTTTVTMNTEFSSAIRAGGNLGTPSSKSPCPDMAMPALRKRHDGQQILSQLILKDGVHHPPTATPHPASAATGGI